MLNLVSFVFCGSDLNSLFKQVAPAVFYLKSRPIDDEYHLASGFFINSSGTGLSVAHFITNVRNHSSDFELYYQGQKYPVKVRHLDKKNDVAVVQAQGLHNTPFLRLASSEAVLGQQVILFGHNGSELLAPETGYVLDTQFNHFDGVPAFRTSIWAGPGYSGAPVTDANGAVVGLQWRLSGLYLPEFMHDCVVINAATLAELAKKAGVVLGK